MRYNYSLLLIFLCTRCAYGSLVDYTGHQVWRIESSLPSQTSRLADECRELGLDVWSSSSSKIDVAISPSLLDSVSQMLDDYDHVHYSVMIPDIQRTIDAERKHKSTHNSRDLDLEQYHTLAEIEEFLSELDASNELASLESVGTTAEGRDLWILKISNGQTTGKSALSFDCGIHAREWISPAICLWIISALTSNQTETVMNLLETHDFYFMPVMNADGYEYTWNENRLWRKNRRENGDDNCIGVDLNRNYNATNWGGIGASNNTCADTYHGVSPFSEAETQALTGNMLSLNAGDTPVKASFSIHSYGQLWLFAYGWSSDLPADYDEMQRVADAGVAAIETVDGQIYTAGPHYTTIYPSTGTVVDWGYEILGLPYTYIIEARDKGDYGFLLPDTLIAVTASEVWQGIQAAINAI